jgi:hypothetical protein
MLKNTYSLSLSFSYFATLHNYYCNNPEMLRDWTDSFFLLLYFLSVNSYYLLGCHNHEYCIFCSSTLKSVLLTLAY